MNNTKYCISVIQTDGKPGTKVEVTARNCIIGSSKSADVTVNIDSVAARHCILIVDDDGRVKLLDMANGSQFIYTTLVNGEAVEEAILLNNSVITIGERSFLFSYPKKSYWANNSRPTSAERAVRSKRVLSTQERYAATPSRPAARTPTPRVKTHNTKSVKNVYRRLSRILPLKALPQSEKIQRSAGTGTWKSKAKQKVSFGPKLTPEQFDARCPPSTPLKKGGEVKTQFLSEKPLLKASRTKADGRVSQDQSAASPTVNRKSGAGKRRVGSRVGRPALNSAKSTKDSTPVAATAKDSTKSSPLGQKTLLPEWSNSIADVLRRQTPMSSKWGHNDYRKVMSDGNTASEASLSLSKRQPKVKEFPDYVTSISKTAVRLQSMETTAAAASSSVTDTPKQRKKSSQLSTGRSRSKKRTGASGRKSLGRSTWADVVKRNLEPVKLSKVIKPKSKKKKRIRIARPRRSAVYFVEKSFLSAACDIDLHDVTEEDTVAGLHGYSTRSSLLEQSKFASPTVNTEVAVDSSVTDDTASNIIGSSLNLRSGQRRSKVGTESKETSKTKRSTAALISPDSASMKILFRRDSSQRIVSVGLDDSRKLFTSSPAVHHHYHHHTPALSAIRKLFPTNDDANVPHSPAESYEAMLTSPIRRKTYSIEFDEDEISGQKDRRDTPTFSTPPPTTITAAAAVKLLQRKPSSATQTTPQQLKQMKVLINTHSPEVVDSNAVSDDVGKSFSKSNNNNQSFTVSVNHRDTANAVVRSPLTADTKSSKDGKSLNLRSRQHSKMDNEGNELITTTTTTTTTNNNKSTSALISPDCDSMKILFRRDSSQRIVTVGMHNGSKPSTRNSPALLAVRNLFHRRNAVLQSPPENYEAIFNSPIGRRTSSKEYNDEASSPPQDHRSPELSTHHTTESASSRRGKRTSALRGTPLKVKPVKQVKVSMNVGRTDVEVANAVSNDDDDDGVRRAFSPTSNQSMRSHRVEPSTAQLPSGDRAVEVEVPPVAVHGPVRAIPSRMMAQARMSIGRSPIARRTRGRRAVVAACPTTAVAAEVLTSQRSTTSPVVVLDASNKTTNSRNRKVLVEMTNFNALPAPQKPVGRNRSKLISDRPLTKAGVPLKLSSSSPLGIGVPEQTVVNNKRSKKGKAPTKPTAEKQVTFQPTKITKRKLSSPSGRPAKKTVKERVQSKATSCEGTLEEASSSSPPPPPMLRIATRTRNQAAAASTVDVEAAAASKRGRRAVTRAMSVNVEGGVRRPQRRMCDVVTDGHISSQSMDPKVVLSPPRLRSGRQLNA